SSWPVAARNSATGLTGDLMSDRDRAAARVRNAARVLRLAAAISIVLTSQIVQVTTEAKASPTMTAFTTTSADMNMPQGDRSRGSAAAPMIGVAGRAGSEDWARAAPARNCAAISASDRFIRRIVCGIDDVPLRRKPRTALHTTVQPAAEIGRRPSSRQNVARTPA